MAIMDGELKPNPTDTMMYVLPRLLNVEKGQPVSFFRKLLSDTKGELSLIAVRMLPASLRLHLFLGSNNVPDVTIYAMESTQSLKRPGEDSQLLAKSTAGASFLIVLQVGSRALTFAVNQLLLRFLSPEVLGISTQLEVYSISVLFFSREALRVAFQRQTDAQEDVTAKENAAAKEKAAAKDIIAAEKTQTIVNLAYISIGLGILFSGILQWAYLRSLRSNPSILEAPFFQKSLQIYGIATFLELLAEPSFSVVTQKSKYKIRAAAESVGTVLRCALTCGATVLASKRGWEIGVLPFALGQFAYAVSLLIVYLGNIWLLSIKSKFSLFPRYVGRSSQYLYGYLSKPLLTLGASLFVQGVLKHFLTQGDVLLISYLATLEAQGVYALASNYGGLVARLILQPIEESSRNYFGKQLSSIDKEPTKDNVETASRHLHQLLRIYVLLSTSAAVVGPTAAPLLLGLVAGSRWTSSGAGQVLGKYCYYIPLLAINGVTEAFISAVASKSQLNKQSVWMVGFSICFGAAGYIFLAVYEMGAEGLVWANVINMSIRILWSFYFIKEYLSIKGSKLDLRVLTPRPTTLAAGVGTAAILHRIRDNFTGGILDCVKVGLVAGLYVITLATSERRYLLQLFNSLKSSRR